MLFIGLNGTPSCFVIKATIYRMKMYNIKIEYQYTSEQTLTSYCKDLTLFNYMNCVYPKYLKDSEDEEDDLEADEYEPYDKTSPYLPDFLYEIQIAYDLYYSDDVDDEYIIRIINEYKESKKNRLNKMIKEGKPYNI